MSHTLISRSPDLRKLVDEGYRIDIRSGHLVAHDIPYVNAKRELRLGKLVTDLQISGERTAGMGTHVMHFVGEYPCDKNGKPIEGLRHASNDKVIEPSLVVNHSFSSKPRNGKYTDYHHKMSTYANIVSAPAEALDPSVTARPRSVIKTDSSQSVFKYTDSASSRAGITELNERFASEVVGIIGLGGTGSYVLDLVAKTPVKEIHLYDADEFLQHNAFRSPGAPTVKRLDKREKKVEHFRRIYQRMRRGIYAHPVNICTQNPQLLDGLTFVFVCIDDSCAKKGIIESLEVRSIAFIDVGMGIHLQDSELRGIVRTTLSTPKARDHVHSKGRIPFSEKPVDEAYSENIQIADLNALNASLAVIRWKRHLGYYADIDKEYFSTYTIDGNSIANDDHY